MSSLATTGPVRAAALSKSTLHLPVRGAVAMPGLRIPVLACSHHSPLAGKRFISTTQQKQVKEYFPPPPHTNVKGLETAWAHPV